MKRSAVIVDNGLHGNDSNKYCTFSKRITNVPNGNVSNNCSEDPKNNDHVLYSEDTSISSYDFFDEVSFPRTIHSTSVSENTLDTASSLEKLQESRCFGQNTVIPDSVHDELSRNEKETQFTTNDKVTVQDQPFSLPVSEARLTTFPSYFKIDSSPSLNLPVPNEPFTQVSSPHSSGSNRSSLNSLDDKFKENTSSFADIEDHGDPIISTRNDDSKNPPVSSVKDQPRKQYLNDGLPNEVKSLLSNENSSKFMKLVLPSVKRLTLRNGPSRTSKLKSRQSSMPVISNSKPKSKKSVRKTNHTTTKNATPDNPKATVDSFDKNLILKPVYQEWIDMNGEKKDAYGIITSNSPDNQFYFIVHFYSSYSTMISELSNLKVCASSSSKVAKKDITNFKTYIEACSLTARSLAIAFEQKKSFDATPLTRIPKDHYYKWLIPSKLEKRSLRFRGNDIQGLVIHVKKAKLTFVPFASTIKHAGLGLYCYYEPISTTAGDKGFQLNPGEFLDLGVYGPLNQSHRKSHHIMLVKNFIHEMKCEVWQFGASLQSKEENLHYIDITCDFTGTPCEEAKRNPIIYANETLGNEVATVHSQQDPEGRIHYYIGHEAAASGPLRIPSRENPIELKISYGGSYETVRNRFGYGRSTSDMMAACTRMDTQTEDEELLKEIQCYEMAEICEIRSFLSRFYVWENTLSTQIRCRVFILSLVLFDQAQKLCNNMLESKLLGDETVKFDTMVEFAEKVLAWYPQRQMEDFNDLIIENQLFCKTVKKILRLSNCTDEVKLLNRRCLRTHMIALLK